MGTIAEGMSNFAQPLIEATDGSPEQLQRALMLSQLCWNLALTPEGQREEFLGQMQPALNLDDTGFEEFKRAVVAPMLRRHQEMFPAAPRRAAAAAPTARPRHVIPQTAPPVRQYAGTGRNDPCSCGSGKKFKRYCGG